VVLSTEEDHTGAIRLAEVTSRPTFKTKHIAVQYHFFREHLHEEIQVKIVDTTNQLADIFTKGLAAPQFHHLAARLMGWPYVAAIDQYWGTMREHSSDLETRRMRGSDAGDASGQGLIAGLIIGQGQLTRQAESSVVPPVRQVLWMDPIDDGRMVRGSIAQWNGARLPVELRLQQLQRLQLGRMQWYQVDLTTGLRQLYGRPTRLRLWYQVHTGTGLQQQPLGCRHLVVCEWVRHQQPGRRPARPHRLHRPSTQATWSRLSTSNGRQNYLVPGNKATQQRRPSTALPRMANIYVVPMLHSVG